MAQKPAHDQSQQFGPYHLVGHGAETGDSEDYQCAGDGSRMVLWAGMFRPGLWYFFYINGRGV